MNKSAFALLILTLFATGSSIAMSLGRYRGVALIGRPLDISVQAVLGVQDDPAALCIEADAFYADNRLDRSLVRVSTEKVLSNPLDTLIRIRSSVPVDEPVVTLTVRAGCQQKTERRYVILTDLASEPASLAVQPSVSATDAGAGTSSSLASSAPKSNNAVGTPAAPLSASPSNSASTAPSVRLAASTPARRASARPVAASAGESSGGSNGSANDNASDGVNTASAGQATASTASNKNTPVVKRDRLQADTAGASGQNASGQARLKLEPLDVSIERDPQLKPSTELLSAPAPGEQRSAAAVLWRALAAQPQDIIKDAEKIQSLESSLNTLREQTQKNQLALNELSRQFEKTRSERYANGLVYVLALLLLLALAGLAYVWRLRARPDATAEDVLPWWRKNKPLETGWANNLPESAFPLSPALATSPDPALVEDNNSPNDKKKKKKDAKLAPALQSPESTLGADEPAFTQVRHMSNLDSDFQLSSPSSFDFTVSMPQVARSVKAEELFDVQQQADFFVSLGQHEQAIELLRGHIADNSQASPLVYMDLFDLYHQLERQTDYEALRADFNQLFTGKIPAFESYADLSAGLDAYPVALTRIEALWPSAKVLEVIEESILRRPVSKADAFDLEAYRELLLLYAVAKELAQPQGSQNAGALRFDLPDTPSTPSTPFVTPPETSAEDVPPADASSEDSAAHLSGFSLTSIEPLSASADNKAASDVDLLLPPQSPRLALDVDLDDLLSKTTGTPLPGVGTQPNSNFFARLGTKIPVSSLARSPVVSVAPPAAPPVAPYKLSADDDNLINFDDLDVFIKNLDSTEPPKI